MCAAWQPVLAKLLLTDFSGSHGKKNFLTLFSQNGIHKVFPLQYVFMFQN